MSLGMETICSIYENTKQIGITFYLFQEIVTGKLNTAYSKKLFKMGCDINEIKQAIEEISTSIALKDFDAGYLRPDAYKLFCSVLNISFIEPFDDYYTFVFDDYSSKVLSTRTNMKINQKEFSKLLGISPSDISEIENGTKYPIRSQFVKLRKNIKLQNI